MKEKVLIFGASGGGRTEYERINKEGLYEVMAFVDNMKNGTTCMNLPVIAAKEIYNYNYDAIIITSLAAEDITNQLIELGVKRTQIIFSSITKGSESRIVFLKSLVKEFKRKKIEGAVAEAGVFRGDFSAVINNSFFDRKCYLFDTFEGFDSRDFEFEHENVDFQRNYSHFENTSVELVMSKMSYPQNVVIKKGYVPDTFEDVNDEFCFVNLDMDLCRPTVAALNWFWPRMVKEGVILIHDYFDEWGEFHSLQQGVSEFVDKNDISTIPIGDLLSIALVKR